MLFKVINTNIIRATLNTGKKQDFILIPGQEIELPEDNQYVKDLLDKKKIEVVPVVETAATSAKKQTANNGASPQK